MLCPKHEDQWRTSNIHFLGCSQIYKAIRRSSLSPPITSNDVRPFLTFRRSFFCCAWTLCAASSLISVTMSHALLLTSFDDDRFDDLLAKSTRHIASPAQSRDLFLKVHARRRRVCVRTRATWNRLVLVGGTRAYSLQSAKEIARIARRDRNAGEDS